MQTWDDVLALEGFSSGKNRSLLNSVVGQFPNANVLEIGSYLGSTAVAMCYGNSVGSIHLVDNHSEFGDTRERLAATARRWNLPATIHDFDYFAAIPADAFGGTKFDVYHYDGPHDESQHARELEIALPHLADSFAYIVDDYSWDMVRRGCDAGLRALSDRVNVRMREQYDSAILNDHRGYWNGVLIAWCDKT